MCKKFIEKAAKNRKLKRAKRNCERAAIMASKCARTFEETGNQELADWWWQKYNRLYDAIAVANTVL